MTTTGGIIAEMDTALLDHGRLTLVDHSAHDLSVVNAARVSLGKRSAVLDEAGEKLIGFLMKNKHGTPFEHNHFSFRVKAPIFVFREWHRHRIGHSYNELSGRYAELKDEFYLPSNVRVQKGKPGAYTYEPAPGSLSIPFVASLRIHCEQGFAAYQEAIRQGVAREQARLFLAVNTYSEMIWSCNARSLMAFLELRAAPSAQWEIQQYAYAAEAMFKELMPVTHAAFEKNGRVAP